MSGKINRSSSTTLFWHRPLLLWAFQLIHCIEVSRAMPRETPWRECERETNCRDTTRYRQTYLAAPLLELFCSCVSWLVVKRTSFDLTIMSLSRTPPSECHLVNLSGDIIIFKCGEFVTPRFLFVHLTKEHGITIFNPFAVHRWITFLVLVHFKRLLRKTGQLEL